jgi:hypothetical protein
VGVQPTVDGEQPHQSSAGVSPTPYGDSGRATRVRQLALRGARIVVGLAVIATLTAGMVAGLVAGGLYMTPLVSAAAVDIQSPPRRPPIVPPSVPEGAREDWAVWSYVDKINQAWGKDWPLVIQWFEELDARYPGNPMVKDKLYVSYLEDGRNRLLRGDVQGARQRFEQAARYDPDRGVADEMLAELDKQLAGPSR